VSPGEDKTGIRSIRLMNRRERENEGRERVAEGQLTTRSLPAHLIRYSNSVLNAQWFA
jgi:hypothetical protein